MQETNYSRHRKTDSKKFMVVLLASFSLNFCLVVVAVLTWYGMAAPEMMVAIPILAGVYPLYLGANATQKVMTHKNGKENKTKQ